MTDVVNGYGMTEGCGASTSARLDDYETGQVGGPLPNCKIRLRDLPEMGYTSASNPKRGEICFKGASIGNGYFDNQEKTDETFVNGWLLSGDVGEIDENGKITIIDRAKNIFKLANGEYIAPEKIENAFVQSEWVLQSWVYGDSLKDSLVTFIVVDPDQLAEYAEANGLDKDSDEILEDPKLRQTVYNSIIKFGDDNKLLR